MGVYHLWEVTLLDDEVVSEPIFVHVKPPELKPEFRDPKAFEIRQGDRRSGPQVSTDVETSYE